MFVHVAGQESNRKPNTQMVHPKTKIPGALLYRLWVSRGPMMVAVVLWWSWVSRSRAPRLGLKKTKKHKHKHKPNLAVTGCRARTTNEDIFSTQYAVTQYAT